MTQLTHEEFYSMLNAGTKVLHIDYAKHDKYGPYPANFVFEDANGKTRCKIGIYNDLDRPLVAETIFGLTAQKNYYDLVFAANYAAAPVIHDNEDVILALSESDKKLFTALKITIARGSSTIFIKDFGLAEREKNIPLFKAIDRIFKRGLK